MLGIAGRRLLTLFPTLLFIAFITFFAAALAPGDPIRVIAGEHALPEQVAQIRHEYGLDQPAPVRFWNFIKNAAVGQFGISYHYRRPAGQILAEGFIPTAQLAFSAIFLASIVGVILGMIGAVRVNTGWDQLTLLLALLGAAVPSFVMAPLLVLLLSLKLNWLPVAGWGGVQYMIMPVMILASRPAALVARITRASMLEVLNQDYIRTARAKGLSFSQTVFRHAFRNALPPVIIGIGSSFGFLLTGSFIVETIFGVPGLGAKSVEAIQQRDYPVIQATTLLFAALFVFVNLIVDIGQAWLDPRIRTT